MPPAIRPTTARSFRLSDKTIGAMKRLRAKINVVSRSAVEVTLDVALEAAVRVAERYIDEVLDEIEKIKAEARVDLAAPTSPGARG